MKTLKFYNGEWKEYTHLLPALNLPEYKGVWTTIGAGGKTTTMHQLADELVNAGKKAVLTTTTHMAIEANMACSVEEVKRRLNQEKQIVAGIPDDSIKFVGFCNEGRKKLMGICDVLLVEGDGSKRYPCKAPGKNEPVIPKETTHIFLLCGTSALYKPIREVCFRIEEVLDILNKPGEASLEEEDVLELLEKGYMKRLKNEEIKVPPTLIINQAEMHLEAAKRIAKRWRGSALLTTYR